jgi:hypothetical protein
MRGEEALLSVPSEKQKKIPCSSGLAGKQESEFQEILIHRLDVKMVPCSAFVFFNKTWAELGSW